MVTTEFEQGPEPQEEVVRKYRDFIDRHQEDGRYSWELGLGGLLSTLTPEPKAITLYFMPPETPFFTDRQLGRNVLDFLENMGLPRKLPIVYQGPWHYCENPSSNGEGSLVSIGAVVKELNYQTAEGNKTAYMVSSAGRDLARPLIVNVGEWVKYARESNIPHKFDSMWKILSSVSSSSGNRRPLALFRVVEYLIKNPGSHRLQDLIEALKGNVDTAVISHILNSIGNAGIIDYDSPTKEAQGKRQRGWLTYRLVKSITYQDALNRLRGQGRFDYPGDLQKVIRYMEDNPKGVYEFNELARKLGISRDSCRHILSPLEKVGILEQESGFSNTLHSRARANELTKSLYEMILLPAKEEAQTLKPANNKGLSAELIRVLLENYQEEKTSIGAKGGEEVRGIILQLLSDLGEMKLSYIMAEGNKRLEGRELSIYAWSHQAVKLVKESEIEKGKKGFYKPVNR